MTLFRSEKNTNWEGAYGVPAVVKWPGRIRPGSVANGIVSYLDWMPTLLAAADVPEVKEKTTYGLYGGELDLKVHLDGYNMLSYFTGQTSKNPRDAFFYFSDDAGRAALR